MCLNHSNRKKQSLMFNTHTPVLNSTDVFSKETDKESVPFPKRLVGATREMLETALCNICLKGFCTLLELDTVSFLLVERAEGLVSNVWAICGEDWATRFHIWSRRTTPMHLCAHIDLCACKRVLAQARARGWVCQVKVIRNDCKGSIRVLVRA